MRKVLNIAPSQRYTRRPTHSQTTNLGVRSSNLSGRAIYVTGKPSLFRSSRTHRRLEDPISLRFSLRNSRKILALVGPRSGGCNPPLSCGGSRPLPSVEMRQRWLQRKWFALLRFRAALAGEASLDEAAQRAKSAASFKGGMRTLGARLMDHFDLHRALRPNASSRKVAQGRGAIGGGSPANFVRAARGWQHGVPVGVLTPPADAQTTTSFLDPCGGRISAISSRCRDITRRLSDTQFGDVCRATKTENKAASATLTAGLDD